ncbi:MAG TPA: phosphate/phosphite/phosphonate ABC transporter substrate-binding protein [Thermoleophilaceae bacterium]|jgi:ABC-type phosphate/phosphonate transport system substrate-binding protein
MTRPLLVGAVAYHPRVVTIWEAFRDYFARAGVDLDFVLFSNYERQVEELLDGRIDVAWHTNTAFVVTEARVGGGAQVLGMRDVDRDFATVLVTRRGDSSLDGPAGVAGRRLALGSGDSGHAAILPLHYVRAAGVDPESDVELVRFDTDIGKHGDTGSSETDVARAVAEGEADVGAMGDAVLAGLRERGFAPAGELEVAWRSEPYYHCTFTALPDFDGERARRFEEALLAMDYNDPEMRPPMDLESVRKWHPSDKVGYETLTVAMREQGLIR